MHNFENETRDRLIDAARTDVAFLAERQTAVSDALDRLGQQAHGDADRLRGAAEQLRRHFTGAEAIPLLEAAAHLRREELPRRCVRAIRHDRQRLGVGGRLLRPVPVAAGHRLFARVPRRQLVAPLRKMAAHEVAQP